MTKAEVLERNLGGENLLWSESPKPEASFRGQTIFIFIFGIIWVCFMLVLTSIPDKNGSHTPGFFRYFMAAFGVFFILLSLSDVIRAFFSIYGITEKRLLIVRKYPWAVEFESFFKQDIEFVKKIKKNNGSGNIIFKTIRVQSGKGCRDKDIGFLGINNVDFVEEIIIKNFRND
jgi:hypothetical protein